MHIVISTKLYFPVIGGSIVYARMLAREFSRIGHQVSVITRTPGNNIADEPYTLLRNLSFREKIRLAGTADVLLQVDSSWVDAIPFLIRGVPWFPTVHRGNRPLSGLRLSAKIRLLAERMAYRLGGTIAVSHSTGKSWQLANEPIPNPYDDSNFHAPPPGSGRDVDILFVGSVVSHKGVFVLVEALRTLSADATSGSLEIVFVGEGAGMAPLEDSIRTLPSWMRISLVGSKPPAEVANWMRRSRILVFPTTPEWTEASPLTPLEAAACGCLVVASDSGGTRENVSPDHWIVRPGDVSDLARALSEALDRPDSPISPATRAMLDERHIEKVATRYLLRFGARSPQTATKPVIHSP